MKKLAETYYSTKWGALKATEFKDLIIASLTCTDLSSTMATKVDKTSCKSYTLAFSIPC